jgi:hypothetical protein
MTQPISNYMVGDNYAPSIPKPSLQQYDNYQIYSIVSEDTLYPNKEVDDIMNKNIVAFQTYHISGIISSNFREIATTYL